MKESNKIGRKQEKKAWGHVQQGFLSLPAFASGVSIESCKKKLWELYKTFTIENEISETATRNLPEAYGPYEQDMVQNKKVYEPKRQTQENAKVADAAKLAKALKAGGMVREPSAAWQWSW